MFMTQFYFTNTSHITINPTYLAHSLLSIILGNPHKHNILSNKNTRKSYQNNDLISDLRVSQL